MSKLKPNKKHEAQNFSNLKLFKLQTFQTTDNRLQTPLHHLAYASRHVVKD